MLQKAASLPLEGVPIFLRLHVRASVWSTLSLSSLVQGMLDNGLDLSFYLSSSPTQTSGERKLLYHRQSRDPKFLATLGELRDSSVISLVPREQEGEVFVLHTFPVPKPDGSIRPIVDWRPLNTLLKCDHFQMEGIRTLFLLIQKGDFLVKMDLEKAYWHIRLEENSSNLGAIWFDDAIWKFKCMAFGLNIAPRLFSKHLKPVIEHLRGVHFFRMVVYLDDIIQCNRVAALLRREARSTFLLLECLGWKMSASKCHMDPSQILEVLGFVVDTISMTASIPDHKLTLLKGELSRTLARALKGVLTLRQLARTVGVLRSNSHAILNTGAKLLEMQHVLREHSRLSTGWDDIVVVPAVVLHELQRWISSVDAWNGRVFTPFQADIILTTDASEMGWGSQVLSPVVPSPSSNGRWSGVELNLHINELEILAVSNGLRAHISANNWSGKSILVGIDNTCALSYLLKSSGRILRFARQIRDLVLWVEDI